MVCLISMLYFILNVKFVNNWAKLNIAKIYCSDMAVYHVTLGYYNIISYPSSTWQHRAEFLSMKIFHLYYIPFKLTFCVRTNHAGLITCLENLYDSKRRWISIYNTIKFYQTLTNRETMNYHFGFSIVHSVILNRSS